MDFVSADLRFDVNVAWAENCQVDRRHYKTLELLSSLKFAKVGFGFTWADGVDRRNVNGGGVITGSRGARNVVLSP